MMEHCFQALSLVYVQLAFLQAQGPLPKDSSAHSGLGLHASISHQDNFSQTWPQASLIWAIAQVKTPSDQSRLCQIDKKLIIIATSLPASTINWREEKLIDKCLPSRPRQVAGSCSLFLTGLLSSEWWETTMCNGVTHARLGFFQGWVRNNQSAKET